MREESPHSFSSLDNRFISPDKKDYLELLDFDEIRLSREEPASSPIQAAYDEEEEYDLSPEEIAEIIAAGGTIEYL